MRVLHGVLPEIQRNVEHLVNGNTCVCIFLVQ